MKILFLGDSITQGVGASEESKNYVSRVRDTLGCEVINYGVSGTRIARQTHVWGSPMWNYDFRLRAQIMENNADFVFIFGGTNDYGHGRLHIGDIESRDENTFVGNLRLLIEYLSGKYGADKLCFILPLRRYAEEPIACKGESGTELGRSLDEYVSTMKTVLREYGVSTLDLYENGFPRPTVNTGDAYTTDGVHPNDNGYEFIAKKVCDYLTERNLA